MAETINKTTPPPSISVIVPCYNQAEYLPETLQSVLDQDYSDWECIIVDDGSTDNSQMIALQWIEKDNRFKYFYKENSGVSDTRNYGISQALGEYILPLDGDDKISPAFIMEALNTFKNNPDIKLVYSNIRLFGAKNQELILKDYEYKNLFIENQISVSGIFKKADFLKTRGYNENMAEGLEDWDFWLSFLKESDKVVKLKGFHLFYRIKDISRSTLIDSIKNEKLLLQIFKNHVPLYLEYFNPIRDHIEATYYKWEADLYKKSIEYKIGDFFYSPVKFFRKVFRRIFSGEKD
jgi:glycosyltransferase involved in cell wall biosynthesis